MNLSRFYGVSAIVLVVQVALALYGIWVVGVGRLFVVAGLTLVALTALGNAELIVWVMVTWIAVIVVAGFWYSYRVWKTDPDRRTSGARTAR